MVSFWVSWICLNCLDKNICMYIYIYSPNDGLPWALESVKKHRLNKSTASVSQKKNMAFLVGGFQLKKDATVKLDHFRTGVKTTKSS